MVMVERSGIARARPAADDPRADPLGYWLDQENTAWPVPDQARDPAAGRARAPAHDPAAGRGDSGGAGNGSGADPTALAAAGGADDLPAGWWILPALALSLPAWAVIGWLVFG